MKKKKRNYNSKNNRYQRNNTQNNKSSKDEYSQHNNNNTQNNDVQDNYDNQNSNNNNPNNSNSSNTSKSKLCCFSSTDYIVLSSTLAIALGEELSVDDLNILSTFFAAFSDNLAIIAATRENCTTGDENVFTPPVPDIAMTSSYPSNKNRSKKIVKKKIKKK